MQNERSALSLQLYSSICIQCSFKMHISIQIPGNKWIVRFLRWHSKMYIIDKHIGRLVPKLYDLSSNWTVGPKLDDWSPDCTNGLQIGRKVHKLDNWCLHWTIGSQVGRLVKNWTIVPQIGRLFTKLDDWPSDWNTGVHIGY